MESDVVHRAVTANDPEAFLLPALVVPLRANTHRHCRSVFKQRVCPGDLVGVIRIRRCVYGVAAGRGNHADIFLAIYEAGRRKHHPYGRGLTATHARAGAADIQQRAFGQHHVGQSFLVNVFFWSFGQAAEEIEGRLVPLHILVVFCDHP